MSTEAQYGFTMSVYPRPSSCFGVDTPISFSASTRQVSFRKITDLRLKRLLIHSDPPVLLAVKMILGSGHLNRDEYPRDNTSISSRFVASLLDQKLPKQAVWSLTKELFPKEILQEFQKILNKALHESRAPRPSDRILFNAHGELIKYYPFLLDLKGKDLDRHRVFAGVGLSYLKWRFLGENPKVQDREEDLFQFARFNAILPLKAADEEPQADQDCRGGAWRGRRGFGRGRGHLAGRGLGRVRIEPSQSEPSSAS